MSSSIGCVEPVRGDEVVVGRVRASERREMDLLLGWGVSAGRMNGVWRSV